MKTIIQPIITEKSMAKAQDGKFTFIVGRSAKKEDIKRAAEKMFGVHVVSVSTSLVKGKSIRTGMKRTEVKKQPIKRAVVIVKKGEKISLFEAQG